MFNVFISPNYLNPMKKVTRPFEDRNLLYSFFMVHKLFQGVRKKLYFNISKVSLYRGFKIVFIFYPRSPKGSKRPAKKFDI